MEEDRSLPSYFGYRAMVKSGLKEKIKVPEVHDLIASYCSGGLDKQYLIDKFLGKDGADAKDKLLVARRIAIWAATQTDLFLPLGRGNIQQDVIASVGKSYAHAVQARKIVQDTVGGIYNDACVHYQSLMKSNEYNDPDPKIPRAMADLMIRSLQALNFKAGYCHEFASITCQCLLKAKAVLGSDFPDGILDNISIIKTGAEESAHVFIILKVEKNEYSSELLYCDSWARFVGTKSEAATYQVMGQTADKVYSPTESTIIAIPPRSTSLVATQNVCYNERDVFTLMNSMLDHDAVLHFLTKTEPDADVLKRAAEILQLVSEGRSPPTIYSQPKQDAKLTATATIEVMNEDDSDDSEDDRDDNKVDSNAKTKTVDNGSAKDEPTDQNHQKPSNSFS